MAKEKPKPQPISEQTKIDISLRQMGVIIFVIVSGTIAAVSWSWTLQNRMKRFEEKMTGTEESRWTFKDQHDWCVLFKANNSDLNIPIPNEHDH